MTRPSSRAEQKERTRQEILDRALELAEDRTFASLSLREIARAANLVPTALYRHFPSLEQIGLNLVDDGVRALRPMLREARRTEGSIDKSVDVLFTHVRENRTLFRFLHRERFSGSGQVQRSIEMEMRLIASELTIDLSRNKHLQDWRSEDLDMAANLIVTAVLDSIMSFINAEPLGPRAEEEVVNRIKRQLRLILAGMAVWRPKP
ncbi:TetR family transcriptional regulator [Smaragdicoccus niigatensis]|uniref:TetR family transcriptional regulator n=1 Tax=Smaragdicoccus niigatensis TaxID=359359 RepID=UPI0003644F69|nr:TetR family transcriptional regulator [Smaragdicoccus niigatensis]